MQHQTDAQGRRIIVAANGSKAATGSDTTYAPNTIPLRGTYVAMIFRRTCRNPLDIRKT